MTFSKWFFFKKLYKDIKNNNTKPRLPHPKGAQDGVYTGGGTFLYFF